MYDAQSSNEALIVIPGLTGNILSNCYPFYLATLKVYQILLNLDNLVLSTELTM